MKLIVRFGDIYNNDNDGIADSHFGEFEIDVAQYMNWPPLRRFMVCKDGSLKQKLLKG
jgi:hypothetical protein